MEKTCRTCRFYVPLGDEGSGLFFPDGTEWRYGIGQCSNPDSVHGGWSPVPDKCTEGGRKDLAEWVSCWLWKKAVKKRGLKNDENL